MNLRTKLSENCALWEVVKSQTAIRHNLDNTPGQKQFENLKRVAQNCFQPIRDFIGGPLFISSGFRAPKVNKKVGGSDTSSHMRGEALDLDCDYFMTNGVTNREIFEFAIKELEFDQLIWEFGDDDQPAWVHISFADNNRGQILKISTSGTTLLGYKNFDQ